MSKVGVDLYEKYIIVFCFLLGFSIVGFVVYKTYYVKYYDINKLLEDKYDNTYFKLHGIELSNYNKMIEQIDFNKSITINKKKDSNYIEWENVKFKINTNNYRFFSQERGVKANYKIDGNKLFYVAKEKFDESTSSNMMVLNVSRYIPENDIINPNAVKELLNEKKYY